MEKNKLKIKPKQIKILRNLGLIYVVGQGIKGDLVGVQSTLFTALKHADIKVRATNTDTRANNIIVAVNSDQVTSAVKALYNALILKAFNYLKRE